MKTVKFIDNNIIVDTNGNFSVTNVPCEITIQPRKSKLGIMIVGIGGNNGTTFIAGLLAKKAGITWDTTTGKKSVLAMHAGGRSTHGQGVLLVHLFPQRFAEFAGRSRRRGCRLQACLPVANSSSPQPLRLLRAAVQRPLSWTRTRTVTPWTATPRRPV